MTTFDEIDAMINTDDALTAMRILIIDPHESLPADLIDCDADALRDAARTLINDAAHDANARELLTRLALDFSLCPLHLIDYAICFDDDDPECDAIRAIHPAHDT